MLFNNNTAHFSVSIHTAPTLQDIVRVIMTAPFSAHYKHSQKCSKNVNSLQKAPDNNAKNALLRPFLGQKSTKNTPKHVIFTLKSIFRQNLFSCLSRSFSTVSVIYSSFRMAYFHPLSALSTYRKNIKFCACQHPQIIPCNHF